MTAPARLLLAGLLLLAFAFPAAAQADTISLTYSAATTGLPYGVTATGIAYQSSYAYFYSRSGTAACASTRAGEASGATYGGRAAVSSGSAYTASGSVTPSSAGNVTSCVYLVKASDLSDLAHAGLTVTVYDPEAAPTLAYMASQSLRTRQVSVRAYCPRTCDLQASGHAGRSHRQTFTEDTASVTGAGWKRLVLEMTDDQHDALADDLDAGYTLYADVTVTATYSSGDSYASSASVFLTKGGVAAIPVTATGLAGR